MQPLVPRGLHHGVAREQRRVSFVPKKHGSKLSFSRGGRKKSLVCVLVYGLIIVADVIYHLVCNFAEFTCLLYMIPTGLFIDGIQSSVLPCNFSPSANSSIPSNSVSTR
mmetsp:Transcript_10767/g.27241  ORF Transcript_10767/g.27241 Transcript_10767/m.27241 type:complete len:109 (-) Transcript_10767:948-1274(-)